MRNEEPHGPPTPEPPRREFRFKPTEFEVTNRPTDEAPKEAPPDAKELNRQAAPPPAVPGAVAPSQADNDVHALLRASLARENAKGLNEVVPRKRVSRRKRDYWFTLIVGNALFVGLVLLLQKNVVTLVFGLSGMVFFSVALTWIMWMVLDDY